LFKGAWPALAHFKWSFLTREILEPVTDQFGAVAPIYGTLVTLRLRCSSRCDRLWYRDFSHAAGAGVAQASGGCRHRAAGGGASIIFGHLGFVCAGADSAAARAALAHRAPGREAAHRFAVSGAAFGIGVLTAGVVLAIMVLPFISAVMRDVFDTVPDVLKESGYGLGATTWEVIWKVVVPHSRAGMVGGIMLGLRPRTRRNDGGDVRDRQCASRQRISAGAGHDHLSGDCQ